MAKPTNNATVTVYKTPEQQKPYVKPGMLIIATTISALNGVEKLTDEKVVSTKLLDPLASRFFDFISKVNVGKKLTDFLNTPNDFYKDCKKIGSLVINPKVLLKGAGFGAAIYLLPKLFKMFFDKIKSSGQK